MKKDKSNRYVFVDPEFINLFPNIVPWTRNGNIFDCILAEDEGNYLNIVAVHSKFPKIVDNLHIWIPTRFVQAVLCDSYDKIQIGFQGSSNKSSIKQKKA